MVGLVWVVGSLGLWVDGISAYGRLNGLTRSHPQPLHPQEDNDPAACRTLPTGPGGGYDHWARVRQVVTINPPSTVSSASGCWCALASSLRLAHSAHSTHRSLPLVVVGRGIAHRRKQTTPNDPKAVLKRSN